MTFRVGQKVVCVDASRKPGHNDRFSGWLERGAVYTVRSITSPDFFSPTPGVTLAEIVGNFSEFWGEEYGWKSERFRPVVERKTDISIFTAMLNPQKQPADNRLDAALHDHGFDPPH